MRRVTKFRTIPKKRLFEDPYSEKLLTPFWKFWIVLMRSPKIFDFIMKSKEKSTPGAMGWMFCRFRYIDDVLKDSIAKKEIETVVNLGVGMDCRACYISGIESIRYFEVDYPSVIKTKKAKMEKILGKLPNHVIFVPIDFEKQSLDTELKKAGYNLTSKTLFIWEGVTQYISKEAKENFEKPFGYITFYMFVHIIIYYENFNRLRAEGGVQASGTAWRSAGGD